MDLKTEILNKLDDISYIRKKLHKNAELAFNEFKTQKIIIDYLKELGLNSSIYANTGVCSILNDSDECIAIRADMDALPINGTFHGCGHDYHMAILLGVASVLKSIGYKKCVKFIFQPAEESTGGALPMIKEGILENPTVKNMIGYHVWPGLKTGTIEASPVPSMASVDDFIITFKGKGGHAAMPDLCKNPLLPAAEFAGEITKIYSNSQNAGISHVLTVSSLSCGTAPNVISDTATVMGTLRTFDESIRSAFKDYIFNCAENCGKKYSCDVNIDYDEQYPPLFNDPDFTASFIGETIKLIGTNNVLPLKPTFAAEDFAYFAKEVPSVHFRLGITKDGLGEYPLHSQYFSVHDDSLFYGIYIIVNFIINN